MSMTELAAQLLESPKAPQIIQQVQAILNDEKNRRQAFYEWMDGDMKAEFINGEIVVHSPALEKHNAVVLRLGTLLSVFVDARELGIVRVEKALVELTRNSYEPDICYFGPAKAATIQPELLYYPAPDLIVEVLSKSTQKNDREVKFEDYAAHNVAEYWIIDPTRQTVEVFALDADTEAYALLGLFRVGQTVGSQQLAGFTIPIKAVFDAGANVAALRTLLVE
ncbi:Uma2 family endonuclease [Spirosoma arcticum]